MRNGDGRPELQGGVAVSVMNPDHLRRAQQFDDVSMAASPCGDAEPTHIRHGDFMRRHQHELVSFMPESP
jgi:hypothetical protein